MKQFFPPVESPEEVFSLSSKVTPDGVRELYFSKLVESLEQGDAGVDGNECERAMIVHNMSYLEAQLRGQLLLNWDLSEELDETPLPYDGGYDRYIETVEGKIADMMNLLVPNDDGTYSDGTDLIYQEGYTAELTNRSVFEGWNHDDIRKLRFNSTERTICTTLGTEEDVLDRERKAFQTILDNITIEDRESDEDFEESKFFLAGSIYNRTMLFAKNKYENCYAR